MRATPLLARGRARDQACQQVERLLRDVAAGRWTSARRELSSPLHWLGRDYAAGSWPSPELARKLLVARLRVRAVRAAPCELGELVSVVLSRDLSGAILVFASVALASDRLVSLVVAVDPGSAKVFAVCDTEPLRRLDTPGPWYTAGA